MRLDHRVDLQALRAVAVLVVVLYHLKVPGFAGGYVGVDAFLVLSGYLISRLLLHERAATGGIDLGRFLRRRIRRLLPVSLVVLILTLGAMQVVWSPLRRTAEHAVAAGSALFGANIALAVRETHYFEAGNASALQHYWSLGLEEQFYLLWPTVLLGVWALGRARQRPSREAMTLVAALGVASAAVAAHWTVSSPPLAFFLLPGRVWEFAAGALLAMAELRGRRPRQRLLLRLVGAIGLGAAVLGPALAGDSMIFSAFPWPAALVPVVATAALIWAGVEEAGTPPFLRSPTLQWIGDRSYSWYVWHWPPVVLLGLNEVAWDQRILDKAALFLGTLLLAAITHRLVEEPLRRGEWLQWRSWRQPVTTLTAATGILLVSGVGTLVTSLPESQAALLSGADAQLKPWLGAAAPSGLVAAEEASSEGGPFVPAALPGVGLTYGDLLEQTLPPPERVADNLVPHPLAAGDALGPIAEDGCHVLFNETEPPAAENCTYGPADLTRTWALVGDSHAEQWFSGAVRAAAADGARLVVWNKAACSLYAERPTRTNGSPYRQCSEWRENTRAALAELQPQVIVLSGRALERDRREESPYLAGVVEGLRIIQDLVPDARIVVLANATRIDGNAPACVTEARHPRDCEARRSWRFDAAFRRVIADAGPRVGLVDTPELLCRETCPLVIDNVLVYRDHDHLSQTITAVMAPALLQAAMRGR